MTGQRQEIATEALHIQRHMSRALCGIHQRHRADRLSLGAEFSHRIDRAQCVGNMCERQKLHIGQALIEIAEIQFTGIAYHRNKPQPGARTLSKQLPRHKVTVVFQFGQQNHIAFAEIGRAPSGGHKIQGLRRAARKNDILRRGRIEKLGYAFARTFVGRRGAIA